MSDVLNEDGVPEDALVLAMMLQNAWANELGWCDGDAFVDANDMPILRDTDMDKAAACCAIGAMALEPDTTAVLDVMHVDGGDEWLFEGNDSDEETWSALGDGHDAENLGRAFRVAMTCEEEL